MPMTCMFMRTPVNLIAWKTADFMVEHVPTPSQAGKVAHVPKAHAKYYNASMGSMSIPQLANAFKIQTHAAVLHVKIAVLIWSVQAGNVAPNA